MKVMTIGVNNLDIEDVYGVVDGHIVESKNIALDYLAEFRSLFGGELKEYTNLLESAKKEAVKRMVKKAEDLGANAIIGVRYDIAGGGSTEVFVYGTAVKAKEYSDWFRYNNNYRWFRVFYSKLYIF